MAGSRPWGTTFFDSQVVKTGYTQPQTLSMTAFISLEDTGVYPKSLGTVALSCTKSNSPGAGGVVVRQAEAHFTVMAIHP